MDFSEIIKLSIQQRILLVDAIWESITADRKKMPLTDEEVAGIQKRIQGAAEEPTYFDKIRTASKRKK